MNWAAIWQDTLYGLIHGDVASRIWDVIAGGVVLLLGLRLGFEVWGRPYNHLINPAFRLEGKTPEERAALVSMARKDLEHWEETARAESEKAAILLQELSVLEAEVKSKQAEQTAAVEALRACERRCGDLEDKAVSAKEAAQEAARVVKDSPSVVRALESCEADAADRTAATDAAIAEKERQRDWERLAIVMTELQSAERQMAKTRVAAETSQREAREAAGKATEARTELKAFERATQQRRIVFSPLSQSRTQRNEPRRIEPVAMSTAARAAAKLLGRDGSP